MAFDRYQADARVDQSKSEARYSQRQHGNTSGVDVERSELLGHRLDNIPSKIHPFDLVELHWDAGYRGTGG
ncbi:hypothetical protein D3C80_1986260 [compost metagenome]